MPIRAFWSKHEAMARIMNKHKFNFLQSSALKMKCWRLKLILEILCQALFKEECCLNLGKNH